MEAMSMCIYKNKNIYIYIIVPCKQNIITIPWEHEETNHISNLRTSSPNVPNNMFFFRIPRCSSVFSWLMTCSDTDVKRHLRVVVKHAEKKTCLVRLEFWKNTGESFEKWRWRTMKTHTTWGHLLGCEPWYYQNYRFGLGKDYHISYISHISQLKFAPKGFCHIECQKQQ